jgi:hypothetical protein
VNLTSATTTSFATIPDHQNGQRLAHDPGLARDVISKLQAFDGDDRVLLIGAHDEALRGVADLFPARANEWRANGWKARTRWAFLHDFNQAIKSLLDEAQC